MAGRTGVSPLTRVDAVFWRMKFAADADDATGPARHPEGRSHYGGQAALYLSETRNGCVIASRAYFRDGDPPRVLIPLKVVSARIVDLRDKAATEYFGIDTTHRAADWQSLRARGLPSPTWAISDRVRALGLDGMLYASRTDPANITHLTLFAWNVPSAASVMPAGSPEPWAATPQVSATHTRCPGRTG